MADFWKALGYLKKVFKLDKTPVTVALPQGFESWSGRAFYASTWYHSLMQYVTDRRRSIQELQEMEIHPIISSALDLYAEEATQPDFETKKIVWVKSENSRIIEIAGKLFDTLQLESKAFTLVRSIAKFGDTFMQILYNPNDGVIGWKYIMPDLLTRIEDEFGRLIGFAPGIVEPVEGMELPKNISKPWDFVHFRRHSIRPDNIHGDSILLSARRVWRQLKIIEDVIVLYRLLRAPDRWMYLVEVGDQEFEQAMMTLNWVKDAVRKKEFRTDPLTGQYRVEYNPIAWDDDIFFIMRDGQPQIKVEKFEGKGQILDLGDLEYFRNLLFSALRIPKAYFGFEGEISNRNTLLQQDVRFARTIKSLRQTFVQGIADVLQIHLAMLKIDPLDPKNYFQVVMAPVSYLDELQRAELYRFKAEIMRALIDMGLSMQLYKKPWFTYLLHEFLGLSYEDIAKIVPAKYRREAEVPGLIGMPSPMPAPTPPEVITPEKPTKPPEKPPETPPAGREGLEFEDYEGLEPLTDKEREALAKAFAQNHAAGKRIKNILEQIKEPIKSCQISTYVAEKLKEAVADNLSYLDNSYFMKLTEAIEEVSRTASKNQSKEK